MSTITTIYDQVLTELAAILPDHEVITNGEVVADNSEMTLRQGYALTVGPAENTKELLSCQYSINRTMIITLTRQTFAKETQDKDDARKNLLEDQILVIKEASKADNFGLGNTVATFQYESDSGIIPVREGFKFLQIDTLFSVKYFEEIS